ncbi:hypothetical protein GGF50DRAFT_110851 [Schizophyllum commune]
MSSSRRSPSLVERFTRPANSLADASAEAAHFLQDIEHEEDAELRKWYREEGIRHQRDLQSLTSGPGGKREVVQNTFKRGQIDQRVKEFDNMKDQYRFDQQVFFVWIYSLEARPERTSSGAFGVPAIEYTRTSDSSQSDRSKYSSSTHSHPHRHAGGHSSSTFNVADPAFGSTPALPAPADAFVRRSNASTTNLPSAPWHYASAPSFAPGSTFGGQAPRQTLAPPGQTPAGSPYAAPGYPGHPAPAQAPYSAPAQPSRHSSSHKHSSKHGGSRR